MGGWHWLDSYTLIKEKQKEHAVHKIVCLSIFIPVVVFTGSIRDDPYRTSRKNSLELIELSV